MADITKSLSTIDAIHSLRDGLSSGDPLARLQALELSRKLTAELEAPGETLIKLTWAEVKYFVHCVTEANIQIAESSLGAQCCSRSWDLQGFIGE